jgi:DNA replication and repair protein RecF
VTGRATQAVFLETLEIRDVRNLVAAGALLSPGLNVFVGRNAQGKTSLLEAVGLLARGRSFRSDDARVAIRDGSTGLLARAMTQTSGARRVTLEVEMSRERRRFRVDGREVPPREYQGRLEVVVYSTAGLRVVYGTMRERRQFLDRGASALWPAYRPILRDYERIVTQRTAALIARARDLGAWNERLIAVGAELRQRRSAYVERLSRVLGRDFSPAGERYAVTVRPGASGDASSARALLEAEMVEQHGAEQRSGRTLVGPQRDQVALHVNGEEAALTASAGQARSLLLALALGSLALYREERAESAVALLDDIDSELDDERTSGLCREVAARGQALVTTSHPAWAERLQPLARIFAVEDGRVRAA